MQHQEERFIGGARIDKLEAELGGDLADVSLQGDATVWRDEIGIEVNALAGENHPAVEAGGVAAEVPFADHPGVVAGGLEHFRDGGLGTVEDVEDGVPLAWEYFPVSTTARLGVQMELVTKAWLKRMPAAPRRSRWGVRFTFEP